MRPIINQEEVGGRTLMERRSLATAEELWNAWEIHCLILLSLFLQVFLFLFAVMRRRSTSTILRTVLWLAYLSADSVAIFVLGHLAVSASKPRHQLMSFWAPFVLVHLGGQDTITAFSKQDNELWTRHLLSLVTQVAVAGYVVAKASWPDGPLRAAMVIMFLSGCFRYTERTYCLYLASPTRLSFKSQEKMAKEKLKTLQGAQRNGRATRDEYSRNMVRETLDNMLQGRRSFPKVFPPGTVIIDDIMSVDAPLNRVENILAAEYLPAMHAEFLSSADRCKAYEHVGAYLVDFYQRLYTKKPLRQAIYYVVWDIVNFTPLCLFHTAYKYILLLLYTLFRYVSTPIALMLFWAAHKGGKLRSSRADITVSYILLVGAIVLDVSSAIMFMLFSNVNFNILPAKILRLADYIQPTWCRKQWSEEIAQYSMIERHAAQDTVLTAAIRQWINRRLGAWGVRFLELTNKPIAQDYTPIKEFILDNLLRFGTRKQWDIANSHGQLALQNWMESHQDPHSARTGRALEKIIRSSTDFPTSVLIWNIATDICRFSGDNASTSSSDQLNKDMSRELSDYVMYLVFKCGVMLSSNSQIVHDKAYAEISKISDAMKKQAVDVKISNAKLEDEQQDHLMVDVRKCKEPVSDNAADNHVWKQLQSTLEALDSPLLPRARAVARELNNITEEAERWGLIAAVWSDMLYHIAPRCGAAFHYEHLSTGGEFITHVLLLMYFLGPFIPPPSA